MPKALLILALFGMYLAAQPFPSGPRVLTFVSDVDDSTQPYGLYLPRNFDASRKYPLVISLHADGSNHRLDLRWVFGIKNRERVEFILSPGQVGRTGVRGRDTLVRETDADAANGPFPRFPDEDLIVATPLARGSMGYQGVAEKDVYDVLADVKRRFPIDVDRIYLTGSSMGGGGALWLGLTRPDVWAAIAPVCPLPPPGTVELAPNALAMPVRIFAGGLDPMTPVASLRDWSKRLQEAGARVEYTEYPGVKHNVWNDAYSDAGLFVWFSRFKRNPYPERVHFATRSYKYTSAYWVKLDGLTPGNLASIDARFTGPNQIEIQTAGLDGFSLQPAGHPLYDAAPSASVEARWRFAKSGRPSCTGFRQVRAGLEGGAVPAAGRLETAWLGRPDY